MEHTSFSEIYFIYLEFNSLARHEKKYCKMSNWAFKYSTVYFAISSYLMFVWLD